MSEVAHHRKSYPSSYRTHNYVDGWLSLVGLCENVLGRELRKIHDSEFDFHGHFHLYTRVWELLRILVVGQYRVLVHPFVDTAAQRCVTHTLVEHVRERRRAQKYRANFVNQISH
jgi:hypothetical protein